MCSPTQTETRLLQPVARSRRSQYDQENGLTSLAESCLEEKRELLRCPCAKLFVKSSSGNKRRFQCQSKAHSYGVEAFLKVYCSKELDDFMEAQAPKMEMEVKSDTDNDDSDDSASFTDFSDSSDSIKDLDIQPVTTSDSSMRKRQRQLSPSFVPDTMPTSSAVMFLEKRCLGLEEELLASKSEIAALKVQVALLLKSSTTSLESSRNKEAITYAEVVQQKTNMTPNMTLNPTRAPKKMKRPGFKNTIIAPTKQSNSKIQVVDKEQFMKMKEGKSPNSHSQEYSPMGFIYFKNCKRNRISFVRACLQYCGIDLQLIRNIQFIGKSVMEILTFNNYAKELIDVLVNNGYEHLADFNPLDTSNFKRLPEKTVEEATLAYIKRLEKTQERLPKSPHFKRLRRFYAALIAEVAVPPTLMQ